MSGHGPFVLSRCICCRRAIPRGRLLCDPCTAPLDREPTTEWGRARKAEREAAAEAQHTRSEP